MHPPHRRRYVPEVFDGLARDVELLAAVAGDIRHVSAFGLRNVPLSAAAATSFASLQVQMTAAAPATLRWSVLPYPADSGRIEIALIGERGTQSRSSRWRNANWFWRAQSSHGLRTLKIGRPPISTRDRRDPSACFRIESNAVDR